MNPVPDLSVAQRAAWADALALWDVRLGSPTPRPDAHQGSFAWFSFPPQVFFDLPEAERLGVADRLESIFAHEIGHHVLSPSTRLTSLKITQQLARALTVSLPDRVGPIAAEAADLANLWSDLLINVRVAARQGQRNPGSEPEMIALWRVLGRQPSGSTLWWVVLRAYEVLWSMPTGVLAGPHPPPAGLVAYEGQPPDPALDATLLAETVRTFATDPVRGALRFGMLMAPYLAEPPPRRPRRAMAAGAAGPGGCGGSLDGQPPTLAELEQILGDARLQEAPEHPALAAARRAGLADVSPPDPAAEVGAPSGQGYGLAETLALWSSADPDAVTAAWYAAAARRWVRPILAPVRAGVAEVLRGPAELWESDEDLDLIDWPATLIASPRVVPGVTTRRQADLPDTPPPRTEGIELDLYLDSSGSMPEPREGSPAVLAAMIVTGSVLRSGGRVRVTSFSGPGEVAGTGGFTRHRPEAVNALLTYFGGGTTFPLDLLARRYLARGATGLTGGRRRHLLVLSDDGLTSMFGEGQPAYAEVAARVATRLDTATLIVQDSAHEVEPFAHAAGYQVAYLESMADAPAACAKLAAAVFGGRVSDG